MSRFDSTPPGFGLRQCALAMATIILATTAPARAWDASWWPAIWATPPRTDQGARSPRSALNGTLQAQMPVKAAAEPRFDWSGWHVGGHFGYAGGNSNWSAASMS